MSKWTEVTLDAVAIFINGDRSKNYPKQEDRVEVGIPFVNAADLVDGELRTDSAERITPAAFDRLSSGKTVVGDLLFCLRGSPGRVARNSFGTAAIASSLVILRAKPDVDVRYLYYQLSSEAFQHRCAALNNGSAQPNVSARALSELTIPLPPRPEQQAIAAVLGALDDKIEQNRRTRRALEGLAQAKFKAWFVDFEPVKAKAAGQTSFPGMPPAAFAALPDRLTDSPLGPVPQGWATPPFSELMTESKERVGDRIVPAYSSTNDGVFPRNERFTKELSKSQAKNLLIRRGDLVFGLSREILNFGVMHDEVGAVSPVYKVFRPRGPLLTARYVETMIRERVGYYRQIVKSSSREGQSIMADHFLRLAVLVPPSAIRESYTAFENEMRQMIDHIQSESAKLAALRDYLLPRLLSGRVRVRSSQAEVKP